MNALRQFAKVDTEAFGWISCRHSARLGGRASVCGDHRKRSNGRWTIAGRSNITTPIVVSSCRGLTRLCGLGVRSSWQDGWPSLVLCIPPQTDSPVPPTDGRTTVELSNADRAIGRLAGSGRLLKNPYFLSNTYIRREAVSSTRIEGTQATLDDLFEAETGGVVGADVQEVMNYVKALELGLELIKSSPITLQLVKRLHLQMLAGWGSRRRQTIWRCRLWLHALWSTTSLRTFTRCSTGTGDSDGC